MKISNRDVKIIANKIIKISGQDIFVKGREPHRAMAKSFFCMILFEEYYLTNTEICKVFLDNGLKYDRTSVHIGRVKYHNYLENDFFMQDMTSSYYGGVPARKSEFLSVVKDSMDLSVSEFVANIKKSLDVNFKVRTVSVKEDLSDLDKLTIGLTYEQEEEVLEMVKLKVGSFAWKNSNKTKVYEGTGSVDAF